MEGIVRARSCNPSSSASSKLGMHGGSHVISKLTKPKVRIIHIFAPEVIKTDVANFRELVQRLTGQPCGSEGMVKKKARSGAPGKRKKTGSSMCESSKKAMQKLPEQGLPSLMRGEKLVRVEVEANELVGGENCSTNFNSLDGFGDLNGFVHDLSNNFSLAAPNSKSSHELDGYEDMHLNFLAKVG
ncbi:hypothetical protein OIU84_025741 [Salix udensis]|uniref:VQ domain-containing protein n=1 Tax=Salix udensis TaxID=889485 RepID=A0AAD6KM58_9ROSI|nr:hypothetical protein OIU84_025741 [Salix udensis]